MQLNLLSSALLRLIVGCQARSKWQLDSPFFANIFSQTKNATAPYKYRKLKRKRKRRC